jgi:hypothetical protein
MSDESGPPSLSIHLYPLNRKSLRVRLEADAAKMLSVADDRAAQLPEVVVERGPFMPLLVEARELYVWGFDYGCVAMCGISAERILKDILRRAVLVQREETVAWPAPEAFDQLERVEVGAIARFLRKADLIPDDVAVAADKLAQLRNAYAHARGPAAGRGLSQGT